VEIGSIAQASGRAVIVLALVLPPLLMNRFFNQKNVAADNPVPAGGPLFIESRLVWFSDGL
jgi:hypothetical protein